MHNKTFIPEQTTGKSHFQVILGQDLPLANSYGRYKILDLMAEGTFSKVIEVWDRVTREHLACKIVRSGYSGDAFTEYRLLDQLKHLDPKDEYPFIKIIRLEKIVASPSGEHSCLLFPRMGPNLYQWVSNHGSVPKRGVILIIRQIAKTLTFLHSHGWVHTDLKLENIVIKQWSEQERHVRSQIKEGQLSGYLPDNWEICIVDLGGCSKPNSNIVSTLHYRAPEVFNFTKWSSAIDIWSLGIIVVEILTAQTPHLFPSNKTPQPKREFAEFLGELDQIIVQPHWLNFVRRCLTIDPVERITAEQILDYPLLADLD